MTEKNPADNLPAGYEVPKVWTWDKGNGGAFASINRPIAGPTQDKVLPVGKHPLQLYSLGTPNGVKVTIMLEELLAAGHRDAEYDAWPIRIGDGDQFGSGFVDVNPNSKIPALMDHAPKGGGAPVRVFESASILLYLAEKFGASCRPIFAPAPRRSTGCSGRWARRRSLGGGFGHFYAYAPMHIKYAIDRYAMEVKRQLDVLDRHLADNQFLAGSDYTIADMAIWPWYGNLALGQAYGDAGTFLDVQSYKNLQRWTAEVAARPAVKRGRMVNRMSGDLS
jgi:GST-like protein